MAVRRVLPRGVACALTRRFASLQSSWCWLVSACRGAFVGKAWAAIRGSGEPMRVPRYPPHAGPARSRARALLGLNRPGFVGGSTPLALVACCSRVAMCSTQTAGLVSCERPVAKRDTEGATCRNV